MFTSPAFEYLPEACLYIYIYIYLHIYKGKPQASTQMQGTTHILFLNDLFSFEKGKNFHMLSA